MFRPAIDRRLGRPLPHQLPNLPRADLSADLSFPPQGLCGISSRFQLLSPSKRYVPTCYSPVRYSHVKIASYLNTPVQLACVKPAASVRSEPGSNSHLNRCFVLHPSLYILLLKELLLRFLFFNIQASLLFLTICCPYILFSSFLLHSLL